MLPELALAVVEAVLMELAAMEAVLLELAVMEAVLLELAVSQLHGPLMAMSLGASSHRGRPPRTTRPGVAVS